MYINNSVRTGRLISAHTKTSVWQPRKERAIIYTYTNFILCMCICIQYHFGAMIYNEEEGKGIRNSKIPPQKFKLFSTATIEDILNMGRKAFFSELDPPLDTLHLANSSGQIIDVNSENWTLGKYFDENGYQPSRHKLYIVYKHPTVSGYHWFHCT